jgi:hypothetical protein
MEVFPEFRSVHECSFFMFRFLTNGRTLEIFALPIFCAVWVGFCLCYSGTTFRPYLEGLFLDISPLKIETDILYRNVGDKPTYAEQKPVKVKILNTWRRKYEISPRNSWRHVIQ